MPYHKKTLIYTIQDEEGNLEKVAWTKRKMALDEGQELKRKNPEKEYKIVPVKLHRERHKKSGRNVMGYATVSVKTGEIQVEKKPHDLKHLPGVQGDKRYLIDWSDGEIRIFSFVSVVHAVKMAERIKKEHYSPVDDLYIEPKKNPQKED